MLKVLLLITFLTLISVETACKITRHMVSLATAGDPTALLARLAERCRVSRVSRVAHGGVRRAE